MFTIELNEMKRIVFVYDVVIGRTCLLCLIFVCFVRPTVLIGLHIFDSSFMRILIKELFSGIWLFFFNKNNNILILHLSW